jgi:hypothetical protein
MGKCLGLKIFAMHSFSAGIECKYQVVAIHAHTQAVKRNLISVSMIISRFGRRPKQSSLHEFVQQAD